MAKISINKTIQEIVYIKNQIDGLNMLLANKKAIMAKFFDKSGRNKVDSDECVVYVQERPNITYDVEAIREKLDKEVCAQFIDTNYTVSNWAKFTCFCKSKGIKPSQLKPFIHVERTVNQEKLSKLYEKGQISLDDLSGCYSAEVKKSIALRMKNIEREIPITSTESGK